jgi:hypothetical protein
MHSTTTGHPTPEELIAFVDGDTTPTVADHVLGCGICTYEVDRMSTTQVSLRQALYRFDCPEPHALGEYELDLVAPDERVRIARHTTECEACTAELHMLRDFLATDVAVPEPFLSHVRRVVATLLMPRPELGLAGVRGAATALRQYHVEGATISLGAGPERGTLIGLVALDDAERTHGEVRLLPIQAAPLVTPLDEFGNFEYYDLASGAYGLEIQLADEIIVIQHVQID